MVRSMRADDNFRKKMLEIQGELLKKDRKKSITQIQREILGTPEWKVIEKRILDDELISIKFDRRLF